MIPFLSKGSKFAMMIRYSNVMESLLEKHYADLPSGKRIMLDSPETLELLKIMPQAMVVDWKQRLTEMTTLPPYVALIKHLFRSLNSMIGLSIICFKFDLEYEGTHPWEIGGYQSLEEMAKDWAWPVEELKNRIELGRILNLYYETNVDEEIILTELSKDASLEKFEPYRRLYVILGDLIQTGCAIWPDGSKKCLKIIDPRGIMSFELEALLKDLPFEKRGIDEK